MTDYKVRQGLKISLKHIVWYHLVTLIKVDIIQLFYLRLFSIIFSMITEWVEARMQNMFNHVFAGTKEYLVGQSVSYSWNLELNVRRQLIILWAADMWHLCYCPAEAASIMCLIVNSGQHQRQWCVTKYSGFWWVHVSTSLEALFF